MSNGAAAAGLLGAAALGALLLARRAAAAEPTYFEPDPFYVPPPLPDSWTFPEPTGSEWFPELPAFGVDPIPQETFLWDGSPPPFIPELPGTSFEMRTSGSGLALIKSFEGLRLTAYRDPGGVLTIGYGHTGPDVHAGQTITAARADTLLRADVAEAEAAIHQMVTAHLSQNEFDALASFIYNIGTGAFADSTMLRLINAGDFVGAANQFDRWVYAGSTKLAGLVTRRNAEEALFRA